MSDLIDRQAALNALTDAVKSVGVLDADDIKTVFDALPSVQPEKAQLFSEGTTSDFPEPTRIISETRAIPSDDDRVSLSERVTATFYDDEYEEWSQKTVTVRDVLDAVCDEYTVLPSAQPEVLACGNGELVATPEPKWVPCRNNLPDIGMTVLFCDVDGDEFIGHRASDYWWSVDEKVKSVIAWMQLPEPYKPNK